MAARFIWPVTAPSVEGAIGQLAARVFTSSNFRFAWQFFTFNAIDPVSPLAARYILNEMIENLDCHAFLRDTFDPLYDPSFEINAIHSHAQVVAAAGSFEMTLSAAADDRLGAYSRDLRESKPHEALRIREIFESLGPYNAFELVAGAAPHCTECAQHTNHLFSTWFFGVAWDWCFVLTWPAQKLAWVGCLTDTD